MSRLWHDLIWHMAASKPNLQPNFLFYSLVFTSLLFYLKRKRHPISKPLKKKKMGAIAKSEPWGWGVKKATVLSCTSAYPTCTPRQAPRAWIDVALFRTLALLWPFNRPLLLRCKRAIMHHSTLALKYFEWKFLPRWNLIVTLSGIINCICQQSDHS